MAPLWCGLRGRYLRPCCDFAEVLCWAPSASDEGGRSRGRRSSSGNGGIEKKIRGFQDGDGRTGFRRVPPQSAGAGTACVSRHMSLRAEWKLRRPLQWSTGEELEKENHAPGEGFPPCRSRLELGMHRPPAPPQIADSSPIGVVPGVRRDVPDSRKRDSLEATT